MLNRGLQLVSQLRQQATYAGFCTYHAILCVFLLMPFPWLPLVLKGWEECNVFVRCTWNKDRRTDEVMIGIERGYERWFIMEVANGEGTEET